LPNEAIPYFEMCQREGVGSSSTPDNIQLLCGKHNIQKRDEIE
jgi:hypothetical protein